MSDWPGPRSEDMGRLRTRPPGPPKWVWILILLIVIIMVVLFGTDAFGETEAESSSPQTLEKNEDPNVDGGHTDSRFWDWIDNLETEYPDADSPDLQRPHSGGDGDSWGGESGGGGGHGGDEPGTDWFGPRLER